MGKRNAFCLYRRADAGGNGADTCPYICAENNRHCGIQGNKPVVRRCKRNTDGSNTAVKQGGQKRRYNYAGNRVFAEVYHHLFKERVMRKRQKNICQYFQGKEYKRKTKDSPADILQRVFSANKFQKYADAGKNYSIIVYLKCDELDCNGCAYISAEYDPHGCRKAEQACADKTYKHYDSGA